MLRIYEGLFLVAGSDAQKDLKAAEEHVKGLVAKVSGKALKVESYPDLRLAYDLEGHTKGAYFLVYFETEPNSIDALKRECQISEIVTRALILRYAGTEVPEKSSFRPITAPWGTPDRYEDDFRERRPYGRYGDRGFQKSDESATPEAEIPAVEEEKPAAVDENEE